MTTLELTRYSHVARGVASALGGLAVVTAATALATALAFRASKEERRRTMAGDALVPDPMYVTTQAVTIEVPPERVWPWLAQLGSGRGGWYSYDRIDNGGRPSARRILPEYQRVEPGDVFPALPGTTDAFIVAVADPSRDLVLTVPADGHILVTWAFHLDRLDGNRTRLTVRNRLSPRWRELAAQAPPAGPGRPRFIQRVYGVLGRLPLPLLAAVGGLGHRVMQNQQLRGIKRRSEATSLGWKLVVGGHAKRLEGAR